MAKSPAKKKPETLLTLFKEQLENECAKLKVEHNLVKRGDFLLWWYFTRLHGFAPADVEEVYCDGGGDLAIDSVWMDDDDVVHFYQFKNPESMDKVVETGEVDKLISGLHLILGQNHEKVANEELRERIQTIHQGVPTGYRIHIVSSGGGIEQEAREKLSNFVVEIGSPTDSFLQWSVETIKELQDTCYHKYLPSIKDPLRVKLDDSPYFVLSAKAKSCFFHTTGAFLAELYDKYGEVLLQRNIRVDQGDTATNRSIEASSTGSDAANFFHYNNGVSLICESCHWDPFVKTLSMDNVQVVNGGQTIRALHRAHSRGALSNQVLVPLRAITASGDKQFANTVAVNQNNQNKMGTGFLRSTDANVVQLDNSLASLGWFLERRQGEVAGMASEERFAVEKRIGGSLEGRTIPLKTGVQAYVATFFGQPELAKKNAKKMFLSASDGGFFEKIFSPDLTAEKLVEAFRIKTYLDSFLKQYNTRRRQKDRVSDWKAKYKELFGDYLVDQFSAQLDQVMPQSVMFLCATIFKDLVAIKKVNEFKVAVALESDGQAIIQQHLKYILDFWTLNQNDPAIQGKSWPSLLKSNTFFMRVGDYMTGLNNGQGSQK